MNIKLTAHVYRDDVGDYWAKCDTDAEIMLYYPTMPEFAARIVEIENPRDQWDIIGNLWQSEDGFYITVDSMLFKE